MIGYRAPRTPERFYLCWTNVDGAGSSPVAYTEADARYLARKSQDEAEKPREHGGRLYRNPWGYRYYVRNEWGDVSYRATVAPIGEIGGAGDYRARRQQIERVRAAARG